MMNVEGPDNELESMMKMCSVLVSFVRGIATHGPLQNPPKEQMQQEQSAKVMVVAGLMYNHVNK